MGGLVGELQAGTIETSFASGMVTVGDYAGEQVPTAGGLVGSADSDSTISGSYATGPVMAGASSIAGGFVGVSSGMINTSYAIGGVTQAAGVDGTGDIAGGFAGEVSGGQVSQSFSSGVVTVAGSETIPAFVGGFVGEVQNDGEVTDAYSTSPVTVTGSTFEQRGRLRRGDLRHQQRDQCPGDGRGQRHRPRGGSGRLPGRSRPTITNGYWDEGTTNQQYGIGSDDGSDEYRRHGRRERRRSLRSQHLFREPGPTSASFNLVDHLVDPVRGLLSAALRRLARAQRHGGGHRRSPMATTRSTRWT